MKRLWAQQTLAFSVVVIVIMGAVAVWINHAASVEFRKYVALSKTKEPGAYQGVQDLIAYFQQQGSWEGVERLLKHGITISDDWQEMQLGRAPAERGGKLPQPDILLADAGGTIVFDSAGRDPGRKLKPDEKANALIMTDNDSGTVAGYLPAFYPVTAPIGKLEQQFLERVQQMLLIGTSLAVVSILVLGALLNRRLTAPLQRLAAAARAVAGGDLEQQVETGGSVEVAQVGQAFNEMTTSLKEAETLRQNMVADVAHELRNPLSVLQGNLWAVLNDVYPLEKAEISRLYDETRLLSRLVEDLRELALADAGQLDLNLQPVDVVQIINTTVDNLALVAEAQEVNLRARLLDDLPSAQADPDRVAQVLRNLLVNALRHTLPGGSVTVSAQATPGALQSAVTDTGEGIAPKDLPHIFERFWRVDPARARSGKSGKARLAGGTGLGLSVAQSLVKAQGGRIWAESTPGEGTVFYFTLPQQG